MPSYRTVLLGSALSLSGLLSLEPQEYSTPEGSLIMTELQLASSPTQTEVDEINLHCAQSGVIPWPGNTQIAYADMASPVLRLMWVKEFAWLAIIVGILGLTILPALLGAFVWWLIPEDIKNMINMVIEMLMMVLMFSMIKPMMTSMTAAPKISSARAKPEQVEQAEGA